MKYPLSSAQQISTRLKKTFLSHCEKYDLKSFQGKLQPEKGTIFTKYAKCGRISYGRIHQTCTYLSLIYAIGIKAPSQTKQWHR